MISATTTSSLPGGGGTPPDHARLLDAAFGEIGEDAALVDLKHHVGSVLGDFRDRVLALKPELLSGLAPGSVGPASEGRILLDPASGARDPGRMVVIGILDETVPHAEEDLAPLFASAWVQNAAPWERDAQHLPFGREVSGATLRDLLDRRDEGARLEGTAAIYRQTMMPPPGVQGRLRHLERYTHGASMLGALLHGPARGEGIAVPRRRRPGGGDPMRDHPLIAVSFLPEVVRDTSGGLLPYFMIVGLLHVMETTRSLARNLVPDGATPPDLPMVVNISYGVLAGAKDSGGRLEGVLDALGDPGRRFPGLGPMHLVLPMGNGRQSRSFARAGGDAGETGLTLFLPPEDRTPTYVDLRRPGNGSFEFVLHAPGDAAAYPIAWRAHDFQYKPHAGAGITYYCYEETGPDGPRRVVTLEFAPSAPRGLGETAVRAGNWRLELPDSGPQITLAIQRDDSLEGIGSGGRQARFAHADYLLHDRTGRAVDEDPRDGPGADCPVTRNGTFNTYAAGDNIWKVGGRYADGSVARHDARGRLLRQDGSEAQAGTGCSGAAATATAADLRARDRRASVYYAGLGPDGESGDVLAPADRSRQNAGILCRSMAGGAPLRVTGTSVAAPQVARRIADLLSDLAGPDADDRRRDRTAIQDALTASLAAPPD